MGNTWFIQFIDSYIRLYDKENGHQHDNSWRVCIHTANALKRQRRLQISLINHVSRESNFELCFLSIMVKRHIVYFRCLLDNSRTKVTSTDNTIQNVHLRRLPIVIYRYVNLAALYLDTSYDPSEE